MTFSENPSKLGWPSVHSDHWDPFWKACSDENVVVCMHIGSSSEMVITSPDAPIDVLISLTPMNIVKAAADLIWSPVLRKFPDLKVALSEGGIGWIPYFLERIDYQYDKHHYWTGQDFGHQLPSEVFDQHIITCFIDDAFGVASRDFLNMDNVTWECDYPHSDSTWPTAPEQLWKYIGELNDHDINRITHLNAMKHFSYDPFSVIPKEEATVKALRAKAAGHDVSERATRTGSDEARHPGRRPGRRTGRSRDHGAGRGRDIRRSTRTSSSLPRPGVTRRTSTSWPGRSGRWCRASSGATRSWGAARWSTPCSTPTSSPPPWRRSTSGSRCRSSPAGGPAGALEVPQAAGPDLRAEADEPDRAGHRPAGERVHGRVHR